MWKRFSVNVREEPESPFPLVKTGNPVRFYCLSMEQLDHEGVTKQNKHTPLVKILLSYCHLSDNQ